jgi:hypothetical protein
MLLYSREKSPQYPLSRRWDETRQTTDCPVHILVTSLTTNALWGSKKRNELNTDMAACHATELCIATAIYFGVSFPVCFHHLPRTWREQFSFEHWQLSTKVCCITSQNITMSWSFSSTSQMPLWRAEPFTDYGSSELHTFSSYVAVNTLCLGYRNKSLNAVWKSKNKMHQVRCVSRTLCFWALNLVIHKVTTGL